jgi:F-type H+-transporting ATPase subunit epsilon
MSAKFSYSVATPDGQVATGECEFAVVPTTAGELGILAGHAPLVASVAPGDLRLTIGEAITTLAVGGGIVEVRDNTVKLMVASAAKPSPR